jgi:hypothetical protein
MDETIPTSPYLDLSHTHTHSLPPPPPRAPPPSLPLPRTRLPPPFPARSQARPSGGRGAGCTRVKWKRGLAAAAGQEQRASRWPQRDRKASRVRAGSGVETVSPPNGGGRGPSGVTRAASLAMSSRTRETRPVITVTKGVRSPWWRRQCAFQSAATQRRRSRTQRASASGAGRQGRRSSARSTATVMGKR